MNDNTLVEAGIDPETELPFMLANSVLQIERREKFLLKEQQRVAAAKAEVNAKIRVWWDTTFSQRLAWLESGKYV